MAIFNIGKKGLSCLILADNTKPTITGLVQMSPGVSRSVSKFPLVPRPGGFNICIYMKNFLSLDILIVLEMNVCALIFSWEVTAVRRHGERGGY